MAKNKRASERADEEGVQYESVSQPASSPFLLTRKMWRRRHCCLYVLMTSWQYGRRDGGTEGDVKET